MQLTINASLIYICTQPVDFRKAIDGLVDIVVSRFNQNAQTGIYLFYNRTRDKVKILAWHKNGFVLLLKRLEKGKFYNVKDNHNLVAATQNQLSWLLAGLNWVGMSQWEELKYDDYR